MKKPLFTATCLFVLTSTHTVASDECQNFDTGYEAIAYVMNADHHKTPQRFNSLCDSWKINKKLIANAVKRNPEVMKQLNPESGHYNYRELALSVIKEDPQALVHISPEMNDYADLVESSIHNTPLNQPSVIRFVKQENQPNYKKLAQLALQKDANALQYISAASEHYPTLANELLKNQPQQVYDLKPDSEQFIENVITAIKNTETKKIVDTYKNLDPIAKKDTGVIKEALLKSSEMSPLITQDQWNEIKKDSYYMKALVIKDGQFLVHADDEMKNDHRLIMLSLENQKLEHRANEKTAYEYTSPDLKNDYFIITKLLDINPSFIEDVDDKTYYYSKKLVEKNPRILQYVNHSPDTEQEDSYHKMIQRAVSIDPAVYQMVDNESAKNNLTTIMAAVNAIARENPEKRINLLNMMYKIKVNNNDNEHASNVMNCLQETNKITVWGCIQSKNFNYIAVEPSREILNHWLGALEDRSDKFKDSTKLAASNLAQNQNKASQKLKSRAMLIEERLSKTSRKVHNSVVKPGMQYVKKSGDLTMQWVIMPIATFSMEKVIKPTRNILMRNSDGS